jgi:UrcA family protein
MTAPDGLATVHNRRDIMFAFAESSVSRAALALVGTVIGAALCLGAAAGPANAQTADDLRSVKVAIGDLNLASPIDQKRLDARLRSAARSVCANGGQTVADRTHETACVREAVKATAPQRFAATLAPVG